MKIAFANYNQLPKHYSPEGWIQKIRPYFGVLETLAEKHEVYYFSSFPVSCEYHIQKVHCYFKATRGNRFSYAGLNRLIQKTAPDIVVVYGLHFPFAVHSLYRLMGKSVNIILQSHADKPFRGWRKLFQRYAYRSVDRCLFVSDDLAKPFLAEGIFAPQQIKEMMPASSFFNTIPRDRASSRTTAIGNPVFLWVGRLDENKDPLLVVDCFLQWAKENPAARLYMIYQTDEMILALNNLLKRHPNWEKKLFLIGKVTHEELLHWYNSADFYISGSHAESFGLSLCEAMSCGAIPIVTNIPSFRKMTGEGACGILYEAGNKTSLLNALGQTILIDRNKEKAAVLYQFQQHISFDTIADSFEEIIQELSQQMHQPGFEIIP